MVNHLNSCHDLRPIYSIFKTFSRSFSMTMLCCNLFLYFYTVPLSRYVYSHSFSFFSTHMHLLLPFCSCVSSFLFFVLLLPMLICYVTFFQETLGSLRASEPYLAKDTQYHPKIEKLENFSTRKHENFPPKPCRSGWSHNDEPTLYALRLTRSRKRERERNRSVVFFQKEG